MQRHEPILCDVCGWPSATKQGASTHRSKMHEHSLLVQRNREICYEYLVRRRTLPQIAADYQLSVTYTAMIVQRSLAYPDIYTYA